MTDVSIPTDAKLTLLLIKNDSFTTVTGLTREAVLEKTIEEVLPPSSIPIVRAKYSEAITTGNIVDYLEMAPLPKGLKVGQIRVKPIEDENGIITKILGIAEEGLGLGLWIVREIVNAFNGKVWVTSAINKGSCFSIELPIKEQG